MKTTSIEVQVPCWVQWTAIDESGVIYGHEDEPEEPDKHYIFWRSNRRIFKIGKTTNENWKNSKVKI